jgi:hypothetical protein
VTGVQIGLWLDDRATRRIVLVLGAAVVLVSTVHRGLPADSGDVQAFSAPGWLPLVAAVVAMVAVIPVRGSRITPALSASRWAALLLMLWLASGLPFGVLTMAGLIGHRTASGAVVISTVDWPVLAIRALAFGGMLALARLTLARPATPRSVSPPVWIGIAAFALALPYPVLRVHWALGGTLGLASPGGAGTGWEPLLIAVPWALAAVLSLLLAAPPRWMPRRLLLAAGWSATAVVAMIGPAAFWGFLAALAGGGDMATGEIELWVFGLFYGSWFLWAIAGAAATRAYQLRSAAQADALAGWST